MALRVSARDFAKMTGQKAPHKFNARRTEYDGVAYDSGAEAERAARHDIAIRAGEIRSWTRQPRFELGVPENVFIADFQVTGNAGEIHIEDVKGAMTPKFRRDLKLWRAYGPHPLHVIHKGKTTVIPGGKMERPLSESVRQTFVTATNPQSPHELHFGYADSKGRPSERRALPYEIKGGILYAYCLDRQELRKFVIERMDSIRLGPGFVPTKDHVVLQFS